MTQKRNDLIMVYFHLEQRAIYTDISANNKGPSGYVYADCLDDTAIERHQVVKGPPPYDRKSKPIKSQLDRPVRIKKLLRG